MSVVPEIAALREQLAVHFPSLAVETEDATSPEGALRPINNGTGAERWQGGVKTKKNTETAVPAHDILNLQTSLWPTFQPAVPPTTTEDDASHDTLPDDDEEDDGGITMLQRTIDEFRYHNTLARSQNQGQWRRAWRDVRQSAREGNKLSVPIRHKSEAAGGDSSESPSQVLRLPPTPAPLPPCLQCVLAGACCSLTTTPYAQAFVNDRVGSRQRLPSASSWHADHAKLIREVDQACPDWDTYTATLPRRRQQLEQRLLQRAIVQGAADSPFLPLPPAQCTRCVLAAEAACLQQSRDLTGATEARLSGKKETAWFASSGPPPQSLLRQHCVPLLEQIRFGPSAGDYDAPRPGQYRRGGKKTRRVVLEAVFCRDPAALAPTEVAAQAQSLLWQIFQKRQPGTGSRFSQKRRNDLSTAGHSSLRFLKGLNQTGRQQYGAPNDNTPVRPATALEVARLLPRRSPLNVYARRGVATAAAASKDGGSHAPPNEPLSDYRAAPPALPAWRPSGNANASLQEQDGDVVEEAPRAPYRWQEYFLDVGEDRAAAQLQKERRNAKREARSRSTLHALVSPASPTPPADSSSYSAQLSGAEPPELPPIVDSQTETKEQRQERLARVAAELDDRLRAERKQKLAAGDYTGPLPFSAAGNASSSPPNHPQRSWKAECQVAELTAKWAPRLGPEKAQEAASLLVGPGSSEDRGGEERAHRPVTPEQFRALAEQYGVPLDRLAAKRRQWRARQQART